MYNDRQCIFCTITFCVQVSQVLILVQQPLKIHGDHFQISVTTRLSSSSVKTTWSCVVSMLLLMAIKTRLKTHMTLSKTHNMPKNKRLRCFSSVNLNNSWSVTQLVKCHTKTLFTQDRHVSSFLHVYPCQSDPQKTGIIILYQPKQSTIFEGNPRT